jgi:hypothetical protein
MSMGGGGGGGGAVVQYTDPSSALMAGNFQKQAAQSAAAQATLQVNNAINNIRSNYANAFMDLKPYTQTGIQALDQLNQYMGLNAYDPQTAPTAPIKPTLQTLGADLTPDQLKQYVMDNTYQTMLPGKNASGSFAGLRYTGAGADPNNSVLYTSDKTPGDFGGFINGLVNNPSSDAIRNAIAQNQLPSATKDYNSQMDIYNQQKDSYDYAKQLATQYNAEGPLTPDQVTAKLMAQPGVQFAYNQGLDTLQRAASAKGMMGSGRLLQALSDYGQGMASQQYGDTLSRLAGLVGQGQQAATAQAGGAQNLGNSIGSLYNALGDTLANSQLASGNAMAQSLISANQRYQTVGGSSGGGGIGSALGSLAGMATSFGKYSGLF